MYIEKKEHGKMVKTENPPAPGADDIHWPGYSNTPPRDRELFDPDRQPVKLINGRLCPTCDLDSLIKRGTRKSRDGSRRREYFCAICHRHTVVPLLKYVRPRGEHLYLNYVWVAEYNCYLFDLVDDPKGVTK